MSLVVLGFTCCWKFAFPDALWGFAKTKPNFVKWVELVNCFQNTWIHLCDLLTVAEASGVLQLLPYGA